MIDLKHTQRFLHQLILEAGEITLDFRKKRDRLQIGNKAFRDYVTEADIATERFIIERIRREFPDHGFYGEEAGKIAGNEYRWVIDPIDGTVSFMRGLPFYSVSIALEYRGKTILGAVYQPAVGDLYEAAENGPAMLNGNPIRVSPQEDLAKSVLITGFACQRLGETSPNMPLLNRVMPKIEDIRRFGSAAADCCYVACGNVEGYWELNLNLYDIAAGALIVERAGGIVTDFNNGTSGLPGQVLCTNGKIHEALRSILNRSE
jgi:myo-inositol-1(or 4)-monophosphatase